ncbi:MULTISPECIES: hypothetical protein [unclassified Methylophaga]|uniref:hypothetical protein n=1 Tax=unclassified Methylophaga TaxID=2629249 RepID=UPI000C9816EC|nr:MULTISPECIES: hypothetical protein [unclassified Methylophaga]MBN47540.1 hypothetical protein [Methylophaga sp.]|tara:strand:+ start:19059 stop:19262 length:204 start_codon:yes stop_codon:yes gene_type:complete
MERILQLIGFAPSENEKELLRELGVKAPKSIQVVGRGTLTMSVKDARKTEDSRRFISENSDKKFNKS